MSAYFFEVVACTHRCTYSKGLPYLCWFRGYRVENQETISVLTRPLQNGTCSGDCCKQGPFFFHVMNTKDVLNCCVSGRFKYNVLGSIIFLA